MEFLFYACIPNIKNDYLAYFDYKHDQQYQNSVVESISNFVKDSKEKGTLVDYKEIIAAEVMTTTSAFKPSIAKSQVDSLCYAYSQQINIP